jgi:hypothetical protein
MRERESHIGCRRPQSLPFRTATDAGLSTFLGNCSRQVGESLIQKLRDGIDHVDFVIAVISRASISSDWVTRELEIAMTQEIETKRLKVLPLLKEDCDLPGFLLGKLLFADFRKRHKRRSALASLCRAIQDAPISA